MYYYPEMNEKPEPRLFDSRNSYGSGAVLKWSIANNETALAAMKALRIRPRFVTTFESAIPGRESRWSAVVTDKAFRKLADADLVAHEMLLD